MLSTLLILAVCRTRVTYERSKWPSYSSPRVSRSSVVRIPVEDVRIFLCPTLATNDNFIFVIFYKAYNLPSSLFITILFFKFRLRHIFLRNNLYSYVHLLSIQVYKCSYRILQCWCIQSLHNIYRNPVNTHRCLPRDSR